MKKFLQASVIVVSVFLAYSPILSHPVFKTMDDEYSIIQNPLIKDVRRIPEVFTSSFFEGRSYYRPMVSLSFMLEYYFFGLNPFYYYLTNVLLHIAMAFSVGAVAKLLIRNSFLAWLTALLFAVHPIHWEAVSNIPGRAILLAAFFYINAFLCFLLWQENHQRRFFLLSLICFALGLLSKESAVVFPILLMWYQWSMHSPRASFSQISRRMMPLIPFFVLEVFYWLWRKHIAVTQFFVWRTIPEAALGFLSFLRSVFTHLWLLVFPVGLQFDRSQPVFTTIKQEEPFFTGMMVINLLMVFIAFFPYIPRLMLFCMGWFFIELLPVSQIWVSIGVAPGYISTADHFLYVASIGVLILLVMGGDRLLSWLRSKGIFTSKMLIKTAIIGIYVGFLLLTIQQNFYSRNEISMFEQTLEKAPYNSRIRESLALLYAKLGRFPEAEHHFRRVLEQSPWDVRARIGLGKSLIDQNKIWDGIAEYEKIQDPDSWQKLVEDNTRAAYQLLVKKYQEKLAESPDDAKVLYSLGVVHAKLGNVDVAKEFYQQALSHNPDDQNALFNLAGIHYAFQEWEQARQYYEQMMALPEGDEANLQLRQQVMIHLKEIHDRTSL